MTDPNAAKSKLQRSIPNPAFDTSKMIKNATAPLQNSMAKVINGMKPSLAAWNTVASSPLQHSEVQQQCENIIGRLERCLFESSSGCDQAAGKHLAHVPQPGNPID